MDIPYLTRSRFLAHCEAAIRENRDTLHGGGSVSITFDDGGYAGRVTVEIRLDDGSTFGSDWNGSDVTRFPARIRAAATALLNCGCGGRYLVTHADGSLTITGA